MPSNQPSLFDTGKVDENPFKSVAVKEKKVRENHNLLALDLATTTGWCDANGSGSWNFTTAVKKNKDAAKRLGKQSKNKKLVKFEKKISEYINIHKPKIIVIEKAFVFHSKKRRPNFTGFEMAGIMKLICESLDIILFEYHVQHIKKFGTGDGRAKKDKMVASCARYNVTPVDGNEADALHLYHLAIQDLQL